MTGQPQRVDGETTLPSRATTVIIGGGVMGVSTAYHLAELGHTDVVLLEQGQLSCGTTWHAAGLVGQLRSSPALTGLITYSAGLYANLEAETGQDTGWRSCGSVQVARTPERMEVLRRTVSRAATSGVAAELIGPREAGRLWPLMRTDDVLGAVWVPGDGRANPSDLTAALARGARQRGVHIIERTRVEALDVRQGRARAVRTDRGVIACDTVVICAGQWSKYLGRMAGVAVPLHSAEHFYAVTEQIDGVTSDLPVLRDPDGYVYFKEETGGLVMGGFEPTAKPWLGPFDLPRQFEFRLLPEDLDQVAVLFDNAHHRVPAMSNAGIRMIYNGPESFTPDGNPILGRAPEVANIFVGAGFNSAGIALSGGSGRALAEWIVAGRPQADLAILDIRRFSAHDDNERYLRTRVIETLGLHYAMPWPNRRYESARPLRRSPVHHLTEQAGACFVSEAGWEVPYFYGEPDSSPELTYSFGPEPWIAASVEEQRAAHEGVALFDQSARATFVLSGPGSRAVLARLGRRDVVLDVGGSARVALRADTGGYAGELSILRYEESRYLLTAAAGEATRLRCHIQEHTELAERTALVETSGGYATFTLLGPRSETLLSRLLPRGRGAGSGPATPVGRCELGMVPAWATPVSVGDLDGWQLVVSTEFAVTLYESLVEAGAALGLRPAGQAAWSALRVAAGEPAWGHELSRDVTPADIGGPGPGTRRRLAHFHLLTPGIVLWGGEPVRRDGKLVGHLSSGAFAASVGTGVGLGFVSNAHGIADEAFVLDGTYDIEIGGVRYPAALVKEGRGQYAELR
ncbi:FAD-dependent oxidoreductase [Micromonospora aurantiaca]|uniref:FAD-dependent oxidoreductase n=1 Tax=Micromonospora aurantiaca (nom. illeg.) TaxID=47850 RepID=UPI00345201C7